MEYSIVKSKLMCFNSSSSNKPYIIKLCGKSVDVVDNDLHLRNPIYNNMYAQCSNSMISDFYRRSNQVKSSYIMFYFKQYAFYILKTAFMALSYITLLMHFQKYIYGMA